jgi:hypothetical protein
MVMDLLFSPLRVGGLELENRLVFLPFYLAYPDVDNRAPGGFPASGGGMHPGRNAINSLP